MAGSLTDVWEKKFLDLFFRNTLASATTPMGLHATNLWVALFTTTPSDSSVGVEVTGGSYARVAVNRTGTGFDAASGTAPSLVRPSAIVTFPTATADWGLVNGFGFCSSLAGALVTDLAIWGALNTPKYVANGDPAKFNTADLSVTCD